jgi:hypothetical protein
MQHESCSRNMQYLWRRSSRPRILARYYTTSGNMLILRGSGHGTWASDTDATRVPTNPGKMDHSAKQCR